MWTIFVEFNSNSLRWLRNFVNQNFTIYGILNLWYSCSLSWFGILLSALVMGVYEKDPMPLASTCSFLSRFMVCVCWSVCAWLCYVAGAHQLLQALAVHSSLWFVWFVILVLNLEKVVDCNFKTILLPATIFLTDSLAKSRFGVHTWSNSHFSTSCKYYTLLSFSWPLGLNLNLALGHLSSWLHGPNTNTLVL